jgi:PAS domain S-box-containing protein
MMMQKESEQALREHLRFLQDLLDAIPSPIFYKDANGIYLGGNSAFEAYLGLTKEEIIGKSVYDIAPKELADIYHEADMSLFRQGGKQIYEGRVKYADGSIHDVVFNKAIHRDLCGSVIGLVGVMVDITERKRAEEALRESQQMLQLVLDTIPVGVFWKDLDSNYLGCNRSHAVYAGLKSSEEIVGKSDFDMVWAEFAASYRSDDRLVMETGKPKLGFEEPQAAADGRRFWVRTSKMPLLDSEGRVKGVLGTYEDITVRKKTEEELLRIQKLDSLGTLAGGIAHDFNNLLGIALGNISLAKLDLVPSSETFGMLKQAESALLRTRHLSEQLIALSQGGDSVRKTESITSLLKNVVDLSLAGSTLRCEVFQDEDLYPVNCDSGQILQALVNVIINAREAMDEEGIIEVRARNVELTEGEVPPLEEGKYVEISVRDYGSGIPEDVLPKIFDPYFSTKERGTQKGMGLGLTMTHSIIKRHGGYVSVVSKAGAGTIFQMYLPSAEGIM